MSHDTNPEPTAFEAAAHETLVAGLRNAHALEKQAITVLEGQLKLLTDYPDLHARVTDHIVETRDQARRLEAGLEACGASTSMIKDALLSVMGLGQSSVAGFGEDAVLKAVLADIMQEHLEIATYRTLIALADMAGKPELRLRLEETLGEEEAMAAWFDENLDAITRRFIEVKAAGQEADAAPQDNAETPDGEEPRTPWYARETTYASSNDPKPEPEPSTGLTPDNPNPASPNPSPVAETSRHPELQTRSDTDTDAAAPFDGPRIHQP